MANRPRKAVVSGIAQRLQRINDYWRNRVADDAFHLLTDSQDIEPIAELVGDTDITGAFVSVGDGQYNTIYVTFSSRPWSLDALYYHVCNPNG